MSLAFLTSWRAALLAAGLVTLTVAGWNLAFGPDAQTRLAERRIAALFPGGEPSDALLDRPIVFGPPWTDLGFSLRETATLFADAVVTYEPLNPQAFIMRISGTNQMTLEMLEFALRFVAVDGPEGFGGARFTGPSLILDHTATNGVEATADESAELIFTIRAQVLALRSPQ